MNEYFFIYALDTKVPFITAALSCPSEIIARRAFLIAKRNMPNDTNMNYFGYATLTGNKSSRGGMNINNFEAGTTIEYPTNWYSKENRYWMEYHSFSYSDFDFAESLTKKTISLIKQPNRIDDHDVLFMYHVYVALSELTATSNVATPPVESASADYPQQIQALTGVCVPDTVEGYQEDIEGSDGSVPNVNVVNQLTKEDVAEAVRVGVRDGLLDTDALSQKSRVNEIRKRQEDMLLEQGRKPIEVARIHNRDAGEKKIRTESLRIARNQREEKQK
jgi:hypothetical protein